MTISELIFSKKTEFINLNAERTQEMFEKKLKFTIFLL